jgi:hypothetical protein
MKLSGLFRRKLPVLLALSTLGLPGAAWSVVDGEIEPVNGTYDYLINISNHDITNNQMGATVTDEFDLAGMFQGRAYCSQPMSNQPVFFMAQATLTQSGMTPGYLKLNDYMDVKIIKPYRLITSQTAPIRTSATFPAPFCKTNSLPVRGGG